MTGEKPEPQITCPNCCMTSHHPKDVEYEYCAACEAYHSDLKREAVIPRFSVPARTERAVADLKIVNNECKLLAGEAAEAAVQVGEIPEALAVVARGAAGQLGMRVMVALAVLDSGVPSEVVKAMGDLYADWVRGEGD